MAQRFVPVLTVAAGLITNAACNSPTAPVPIIAPRQGVSVTHVSASATGQAGDLRVDTAAVIEFQYPGSDGWFYAPQLRVTETSGAGGVVVTALRFTFPAFSRPKDCGTTQRIEPGQSRELLPEIDGDYAFTFGAAEERTQGPVGVVLSFIDDSGRRGSITASLPITPGGLPTTHTGGTISVFSCRPGG